MLPFPARLAILRQPVLHVVPHKWIPPLFCVKRHSSLQERPFHFPAFSSLFTPSMNNKTRSYSNNSGSHSTNDNNDQWNRSTGNNHDAVQHSGRTLSAARTIPYPLPLLFDTIASVESYHTFLPFLTASTVTARDPASGYPTRADLTIGYGPLSETFTSRVYCDRDQWVVEARSGDPVSGAADEGVFNYLSTRWQLTPEPLPPGNRTWTSVQLDIQFHFRNPLHAAVMSAVEDKMADLMVRAFERRIQELSSPPR